MKLKIIAIFVFLLAAGNLYSEDVNSVIKNYYEFRGGVHAFDKINSFRVTGSIKSSTIETKFRLTYKFPHLIKNIIYVDSTKMVFSFNGKMGMHFNGLDPRPLPQKMNDEMLATFFENSDFVEGFLINSRKKGIKVKLISREYHENRDSYILKLTFSYGKDLFVCLDATTFELYKSYTHIYGEGPIDEKIEIFYSDYRFINGINIPFHRESKVQGEMVENVDIETVKFNLKIDDKYFDNTAD